MGSTAPHVRLPHQQQSRVGKATTWLWPGRLSIAPNAFASTWTNMEVEIGTTQVSLGNDILDENIEKEKAKSKVSDDNTQLFCVSIDNGWNNRGLGKSYNLDSSHHIMVGNCTGLVVALHYMSRWYGQCERESENKKTDETDDGEAELLPHDLPCAQGITLGPPREWRPMGHSKVASI
jgi:hypothetical protein